VPRTVSRSLALVAASLLVSVSAEATQPAVARPSFPLDGEIVSKGIVFFVPATAEAGAAAIGTAHTFDLRKLTAMRRGDLLLGHSKRVVARTTGFLAEPGRPFNAPGASLAGDFVVYALDRLPEGVRLLMIDPSDRVQPGTRVQILGIPVTGPHDEEDLFGRVAETSSERFEVDMDVPSDLRGWGGAPVLNEADGRVIGMLQAYFPKGSTSRVVVSPIRRVRSALQQPLADGKGQPFGMFSRKVARDVANASPASGRSTGRRSAQSASRLDVPAYDPKVQGPLIRQEFEEGTQMHLDIEYPPNGATVGNSACGVFISGRAMALHGELREFDVVLVIDTSHSTIEPTGADINGNGIIGKPYFGRIGSIFSSGSTDSGDSILAAEVAAARQLLRGLDPRSTRVSIVTFAGDPPHAQGGLFSRGPRRPAITVEPLTDNYQRLERALDSVLARDPEGNTHMAAGIDQATIELMGLRGALSKPNPNSEKVVLFFTDGQPTLPYGAGFEGDNVRAVLRAATRASRANIRIHSFAIGPDALDGPVATVEMAHRTNGFFTPVRHPGDLVDIVEEVSFADLSEIRARSVTTDEPAERFRTTADGSWSGFIRLEEGQNQIELSATSTDGSHISRTIQVSMVPGASDPPVPAALVVQRNRLLEECLRSIKQVRIAAERDRAEQVRKDLMVEIERERAAARTRAAEQHKRLELGVDAGEDPGPVPTR